MLKIHSGESSVPETTANLALERFVNLFAGTYLPVEENYVIFFSRYEFFLMDSNRSVLVVIIFFLYSDILPTPSSFFPRHRARARGGCRSGLMASLWPTLL